MPVYTLESEVQGDDILFQLSVAQPEGPVKVLQQWIAETSNDATTAGLLAMGFMLPWQPIESAPKDGTWVMLDDVNDPDPMMCAFQWDEKENCWMSFAGNGWEGEPPTHWRPWPTRPPRPVLDGDIEETPA